MGTFKELGDAGRRAAKDQFKRWIETKVKDPKAINFMLDQFDLAYELIMASIEKGGMPSKADVIRYLGAKANTFAAFSDENRVACVSSVVSLGLTASTAPAAGAGGPAAWAWYIGAILLDGLDVGGNCYLAYQDYEAEQKLEAFRKQIEARRAWAHANAVCTAQSGGTLASGIATLIENQSRVPMSQLH